MSQGGGGQSQGQSGASQSPQPGTPQTGNANQSSIGLYGPVLLGGIVTRGTRAQCNPLAIESSVFIYGPKISKIMQSILIQKKCEFPFSFAYC